MDSMENAMKLGELERLAYEAAATHPGPWSIDGEDDRVDCIRATLTGPLPDHMALGDHRDRPIVLQTDCGYYEPRGALAKFIAACDPQTILFLLRIVRASSRNATMGGPEPNCDCDSCELSRAIGDLEVHGLEVES